MSAFISQSKITNSMTLEVRHGFQKSSLGDFAMGFKEIHPLNYGNNLSGFDNIAGFGTHVKVRQMLGAGHGFEVSVSSTIRENQLTSGSELTSSVSVKYKGRIGKNFNFGVEVGQLQEVGRLLGSTSFGAFGGFDNSQTTFGSFAASYKIKAFTFFGTISNGSTQINQHTLGLLKEFSSLKTNAFKFGLALGNPFQTNGQLSLSVTQPLRVSSGTALVDIATGLNRWDIITREIRTLSLAPKGHELDFSVAYKVDLKGFSFIANLLHRMNPGHVAKSHSDTSILLHLFTDF
jgi:hypothetical protein